MGELKRSKLDLPPPGKEEEFPRKPLGQIPPEPPPVHMNHIMNGQKNISKFPSQVKPEKVPSSNKPQQVSPTGERRMKNSTEKSIMKSSKRGAADFRADQPKQDQHYKKFPQPSTLSQDKMKYYDHAAANQNSNATSSASKEITPKWNLPSESRNKELLLKHMGEAKANPPDYNVAVQADTRIVTAKHRNRVADMGNKRGSNASQYDNVSGGENENDNQVENSRHSADLSPPRNAMYNSATSSRHPSKGSSPARLIENNSGIMHIRSPLYQGTDDGYSQKQTPPPYYSSPPLYPDSPKYTMSRLNSEPHSPVNWSSPSSKSYGYSIDVPPDKIPVNSSIRQNPVMSPSSRIEVLPADENATLRLGNFNSKEKQKYILPPVDYVVDHSFLPDLSFQTFGQPVNKEASRNYLSSIQRFPDLQQPASPVNSFSSLSVNSSVRPRTSPQGDHGNPPHYLHSKSGVTPVHRNRRDGIIMHESVML
ncbi:unnamed protein product [Staurois parvus]|uniref:USP6 N-terminal-like protein n=1 Tax=Staurois parvus TaxID=386267 RepID=A0ABN9EKZ6_9NEOB|nr:unnamed protein product [Staurois parvus]